MPILNVLQRHCVFYQVDLSSDQSWKEEYETLTCPVNQPLFLFCWVLSYNCLVCGVHWKSNSNHSTAYVFNRAPSLYYAEINELPSSTFSCQNSGSKTWKIWLTSLTWMIRRILMQIGPSKASSDYSPTMCNTLQNVSEWCWKRQCSSKSYSTPSTLWRSSHFTSVTFLPKTQRTLLQHNWFSTKQRHACELP